MRAVRLHELGGPQNLRLDDVALPAIREDEALVRVRAAALNKRDLFITQGLYPDVRLPVTLGSDAAGEIAALGSVVSDLKAGDDVVIDPMLGWGDDPRVWNAAGATILGMPQDGTFAEYVVVPLDNVYRKPSRLSMEEAATIPLAGLTAYRAVVTRAQLQPGETILVTGAGGGVQTFVLLFAKQIGAHAIVTSSGEAKLDYARSLGADVAIDYAANPDWPKLLRSTAPVDVVVDSSGGDTLRKSIGAVRPGGRIVVYGGTNGDATIKLFPLFWKHLTIMGTSMGSPQDFAAMLQCFERGLKPVIDRVFGLEDAVAAFEHLTAADRFGKIVLSIPA